MSKTQPCPPYEALEAHLLEPSSSISAHLKSCRICARIIEQIRGEESILREIRDSMPSSDDSVDRQRINAICQKAASEATNNSSAPR